jgi:HEAT repeat protein
VPPRFPLTILMVLAIAVSAAAQALSDADLKRHIDSLSDFNYATRMTAARMIRRAPAASVVPALAASARAHPDEFVRYRALVILTSFNDSGTAALMRSLLTDRNDRVREVVYRWFERHPSPDLADALLASLNTEQSEFVRPALIRAVAALPPSDRVQRAMLGEIGRGFDFFRSAVVSALGDHRATYAVDPIAALTTSEGTLQDDAVLALGRIGERRALGPLAGLTKTAPDVTAALQAAQCLLGDSCESRIAWLRDTARNPTTAPDAVRAALNALAAIGEAEPAARETLVTVAADAPDRLRSEAGLAFSALALRRPAEVIAWLDETSDEQRALGTELLREGFESLEEDFAEEQFFGAVRAAYWKAADASAGRTITATLIDRLEF